MNWLKIEKGIHYNPNTNIKMTVLTNNKKSYIIDSLELEKKCPNLYAKKR